MVRYLKQLPLYLLAGTLIPAFAAILVRLLPLSGPPAAVARKISRVDIFAIATAITVWTAVFTVTIGCIVVVIMKGPGYVADAYHVEDEPDAGKDDDQKRL